MVMYYNHLIVLKPSTCITIFGLHVEVSHEIRQFVQRLPFLLEIKRLNQCAIFPEMDSSLSSEARTSSKVLSMFGYNFDDVINVIILLFWVCHPKMSTAIRNTQIFV